jgi:hypothetical protein
MRTAAGIETDEALKGHGIALAESEHAGKTTRRVMSAF